MNTKVSIVIPAFNEAESIEEVVKRLSQVMDNYCANANLIYEIIFVDDGSKDDTLTTLIQARENNDFVHYISLSRNFGHQQALKAGLDFANSDCVISMDADLQHPPELIPKLIDIWKSGVDIVYTQRLEEKTQTSVFKRLTSNYFYKILNYLSSVNLEEGTADFRLLDKKVIHYIKKNNEYYFFLRGYISWVGFKQQKVTYTPAPRFAGKTKYSFRKMYTLAMYGITSFSTKPLHLATFIGLLLSLCAFLYGIYAIVMAVFTNQTVLGWASILATISFIGGVQLIMLGIIGEYLGKLFMQTKNRPFYIIRKNSLNGKQ